MFIKRAKSRPSLRARDADDEPAGGSPLAKASYTADDVEDDEGGSVMERKKAQKKKGVGKPSRLSFGGDSEASDTPFKQKKSLLSQSLKLPASPAAAPAPPASQSYSAAYLSELKAATPTRAAKTGNDDDESGLSAAAREKYGAALVEDVTAGIPDAAAIAAAKLKRSGQAEARRAGLDDDYISLGQIAIYDGDKGPHPESRLMREDDEGDDGDEDLADYTGANERLHLGRDAKRAAARREKGERGELLEDMEDDMDDEEAMEWERTLVARGGQGEQEQQPAGTSRGYKPAAMPTIRPLPSIAPARARIAQSIAQLQAAKAEDEQTLETVANDLVVLEGQERNLRKQVEEVEAKREWIEGFRGWIELYGSFLEEKMPKLEGVETDSLAHLRERSDMVNRRRAADDLDDLSLFLGTSAAGQSFEEAGPSAPPRRARRAAREQRRASRQRAEEEGYSTDSALDADDAAEYAAAQQDLESRVYALLADVKAEDFRDPKLGLAVKFADWRARYREDYSGAFGGLALVQAWEFYARGEMVGWEPLRSSTTLESFSWYTALHEYSRSAHSDMDTDNADTDENDLVSEMVNKTVIPLLTKTLEAGAYDPYSTPQTRRAVDLADVVQELAGRDSRKFSAFLSAVLGVYHKHLLDLSSAVASVTAPGAIPPPTFDPTAMRAAMARFVRRRIKVLRNMLLWRRMAQVEVAELVTRLVGEVLRPILGRHWEAGGKQMALQVLALSSALLPPDLVSFLQQGPRSW